MHFICICDQCQEDDDDTDGILDDLIQDVEKLDPLPNAPRYKSALLAAVKADLAGKDPHLHFPVEKCKSYTESLTKLYKAGKMRDIQQPLCLFGIVESTLLTTYLRYKTTTNRVAKKEFRDEYDSRLKTAEKFGKILGYEVVSPSLQQFKTIRTAMK